MYGFLTRVPLSLPAAALAGASVAARFAGTVPLPLAVDRLDTWERFNAISQPAADLVANGRLAKWFADLDDAAGPRLEFINANFTRNGETPDAARYHWSFHPRDLRHSRGPA